jgi:hypothetical protein
MTFMDLYVPMFAAIISAGIVMEVLHFLLGLWLSRRHAAKAKRYYAEMAEKVGMDLDSFMAQLEEQAEGMGGLGMMGMMGGPPPGAAMMTTASGKGEEKAHGQYL